MQVESRHTALELHRSHGATRARRAGGERAPVPSCVRSVLASPGRALDWDVRRSMEASFGHDFSRVLVHADGGSTRSAAVVGAVAYTVGSHVVFGPGQYDPRSPHGRRLLGHELAHVVQQGDAPAPRRLEMGLSDDAAEVEARRTAAALTEPGPLPRLARGGAPLQLRRAEPPAGSPAAPARPAITGCDTATAAPVGGSLLTFGFDSTRLAPGQDRWFGELSALAALSREVEVHGYASEEGTKAYNLDLSCRRAAAVRDLLGAGRVTAPIKLVAHGETSAYGPPPANRVAVLVMKPLPRVHRPEEDVLLTRLATLAATAKAEGTKEGTSGTDFSAAVTGFRTTLMARIDAVGITDPLPPDVDIVMKALILWSRDPGNQWGEGSWDSKDLVMSAHEYATVPASQYKCNAYVAEVVQQSVGLVFKHIASKEEPGKFFPFQAHEWHDPAVAIPHFTVVTTPQIGDVFATKTHSGIYLGTYAGKMLYVSARDDPGGVFGLKSVQFEHGIQIKVIPKAGTFRRFTP